MIDQWGYFKDTPPQAALDYERFWRNRISAEIIQRFLDNRKPQNLTDALIENIAVFVHRGNDDYPS
jgi:hypothetical protein